MKYMLMFWVDESAEVTADDDAAMIAVKSWVEQMTERGVEAVPAAPLAGEAKIVHVRDGELLVSDGPFAETKEQTGGYDVVECAGLEAAIGAAAACRWRVKDRAGSPAAGMGWARSPGTPPSPSAATSTATTFPASPPRSACVAPVEYVLRWPLCRGIGPASGHVGGDPVEMHGISLPFCAAATAEVFLTSHRTAVPAQSAVAAGCDGMYNWLFCTASGASMTTGRRRRGAATEPVRRRRLGPLRGTGPSGGIAFRVTW